MYRQILKEGGYYPANVPTLTYYVARLLKVWIYNTRLPLPPAGWTCSPQTCPLFRQAQEFQMVLFLPYQSKSHHYIIILPESPFSQKSIKRYFQVL